MRFYLLGLLVVLFSFGCGGDDEPMEPAEAPFAFEGNWIGRWSDSLFPSIAASAIVRSTGQNEYFGDFFYNSMNATGPYTPCCGGTTDGNFTFTLDGDRVLDFVYRQNAPDYMGGCPGTYEGEGELNRETNRLVINFTGTDCDGFHDNGVISWRLDD